MMKLILALLFASPIGLHAAGQSFVSSPVIQPGAVTSAALDDGSVVPVKLDRPYVESVSLTTLSELNILISAAVVDGSHSSAGHADGSNCASGNSPLGVDGDGDTQGCFDVQTAAEQSTHEADASAHHDKAVSSDISHDSITDVSSDDHHAPVDISGKVDTAGDTMTGDLTVNSSSITIINGDDLSAALVLQGSASGLSKPRISCGTNLSGFVGHNCSLNVNRNFSGGVARVEDSAQGFVNVFAATGGDTGGPSIQLRGGTRTVNADLIANQVVMLRCQVENVTGEARCGIGKTPTTPLDVNGTATATEFVGPLTGNADTATSLFGRESAVKSVDESDSTETIQDDDELFVTLLADTSYFIRLQADITQSGNAADFKFGFSFPASWTLVLPYLASEAGAFVGGRIVASGDNGDSLAGGDGDTHYVTLTGVVNTAGAAGTLQFQWSMDGSGTSTTVRAKSFIFAEVLE